VGQLKNGTKQGCLTGESFKETVSLKLGAKKLIFFFTQLSLSCYNMSIPQPPTKENIMDNLQHPELEGELFDQEKELSQINEEIHQEKS
jgi:hypothetical protein